MTLAALQKFSLGFSLFSLAFSLFSLGYSIWTEREIKRLEEKRNQYKKSWDDREPERLYNDQDWL